VAVIQFVLMLTRERGCESLSLFVFSVLTVFALFLVSSLSSSISSFSTPSLHCFHPPFLTPGYGNTDDALLVMTPVAVMLRRGRVMVIVMIITARLVVNTMEVSGCLCE